MKTVLSNMEISEVLVESGIVLSTQEVDGYDIATARAIEQAVLQSPELQAWKRDAERYHYIKRGTQWVVAATQTGYQIGGEDLDNLIDSEMGQQNDT